MHQIIFFNLYNQCSFFNHLIASTYSLMDIKNFRFLLNLRTSFFNMYIIIYSFVKILCLFFIYFYQVQIFDFESINRFISFNLL